MKQVALIADDDEFFRLALRNILIDSLNFDDVVETSSLDEAMEQLAQGARISLAVFDLAMPGMLSPANLRGVRECDHKIKVAVVSSSTRRQDVMAALEAGAHGYVPKGLGPIELTSALQSILSGSIYVPTHILNPGRRREEVEAETVADRSVLQSLTSRQREVLELLILGYSNKRIARRLGLGEGTVKIHLAALFRILGVGNRSAAAVVGSRLLSEND